MLAFEQDFIDMCPSPLLSYILGLSVSSKKNLEHPNFFFLMILNSSSRFHRSSAPFAGQQEKQKLLLWPTSPRLFIALHTCNPCLSLVSFMLYKTPLLINKQLFIQSC